MIVTFPINCPWCNQAVVSAYEKPLAASCYCGQPTTIQNLSFNITLFDNTWNNLNIGLVQDAGAFSSFLNYGKNCFLSCIYILSPSNRGIFNISSNRYGEDDTTKITEFVQSSSDPNLNYCIEESAHLLRKYQRLVTFF